MTKKTIFISYSHDSEEHKAWVKKFADDLERIGGFEILLDQNLPKGTSLTRFMEYGLRVADKVLVIGTPQYKQKTEVGKGVAFEESIISADLMQRIDTTKYYPILRVGSFEQSFPPILQSRIGDDITDDTKYDLIVKEIADSLMNEKTIPAALSHNLVQNEFSKPVARICFSVSLMYATYFGNQKGNIEGLAIGVTVTNTEKEIRYFEQPYFKLSVPFEGGEDAFIMLNMVQPVSFPAKLEFGQQFFVSYKLVPANIKMFKSIVDKNPDITIKAVVLTTLGELSESEPYKLAEIVKNEKYVRY